MKEILLVRHISIEGPGTFGKFLEQRKIPHRILDISKIDPVSFQLDFSQVSAVVILGGPMNVDEEEKHPFLACEKFLIRELVGKKIPVLGVCLGAQLIACALGARIRKSAIEEIGWYDLELGETARGDALFEGLPCRIEVFQWHGDTFDLPIGAVPLISGNGLNQAFRFNDNVWGVQFHLEIDACMIGSWTGEYLGGGDLLSARQAMLSRHALVEKELLGHANRVYENFLKARV